MVDDDPNDSDEMLGERLDSALRAGLGHHRVDVESLLHGSQRRAKRVRTQRIAAVVAAAALVVAVPVGYEVVNPGPGAVAPPAVLIPSSSRPAATHDGRPTARPDPAAVPSAVPPSAEDGQSPIPDAFAFTAAELPPGLEVNSGSQQVNLPLVEGLPCAGPQNRPTPAAGRRWLWSAAPGTADELSVSLTVTGWATGKASAAFADTVKAARSCPDGDSIDLSSPAVVVPGGPEGQVWAATSEAGGRHYSRALVQIGDKIVGVQVQHPKSVAAATELANKLVGLQIVRLRNGS
ncbi:MAG TPA: hypothetical protein VLL08_16280 [Kineosporiaceae bacterium]|nr:hypothetical protein [Kineosporiaceae bacterium]